MPVTTVPHDDLIARLADIAYEAVLRRGLRQSFLEFRLEIWHDIRSAFAAGALTGSVFAAAGPDLRLDPSTPDKE